jgi:hypothetical protein
VPSDAEFDQFWAAYPKKKAKGDAEKAWRQMHPPLQGVQEALQRARTDPEWVKEGGQYIPHPATWLRAKGWLDEPTPVTRVSGLMAQGADKKTATFLDGMAQWAENKMKGGKND